MKKYEDEDDDEINDDWNDYDDEDDHIEAISSQVTVSSSNTVDKKSNPTSSISNIVKQEK